MTKKQFKLEDVGFVWDGDKLLNPYDIVDKLNEQHEQIEKMKLKGLKVLDFYLEKLKTTDNFQGVRDEIWIVKQVLTEMDVINDD